MFVKLLAQQLRRPSGLIGKYVSLWMNRSNVAINQTALELVVKTNRGRFLEIGFGGGALLNMAVACGSFPKVSGVDASLDMVKLVRRNLQTFIRQGKLEVQYGDITDLPFASSAFDAVVSLNTIYFWPSLKTGVSECIRILSNDGILVLGFDDKAEMSKWPGHRYGFTMYDVDEVRAVLDSIGFFKIEVVSGKTKTWGLFHCIHARKKSNFLYR
jgi:SAM-dependent methyltransferase